MKGTENHAGTDGNPVCGVALMAAGWRPNLGCVQAVMLTPEREDVEPTQSGMMVWGNHWIEPAVGEESQQVCPPIN